MFCVTNPLTRYNIGDHCMPWNVMIKGIYKLNVQEKIQNCSINIHTSSDHPERLVREGESFILTAPWAASVVLLWNMTPVFLTSRRKFYAFHPWSQHVVSSLLKASRPSPLHRVIKTMQNAFSEEPEAAHAEIAPVFWCRGCVYVTPQPTESLVRSLKT